MTPLPPRWLRLQPEHPPWRRRFAELGAFGWHQACSCLFAGFIFLMLGLTHWFAVPGLPRYDLLLLLCLGMQAAMLWSGMETRAELGVICLFHVLGLGMEIFKIHVGSWSYPDFAYSKVCGVPLFSGFMYASVASYVCQVWRRLQLRMTAWPRPTVAWALAAGIYGNFFANHFIRDLRWALLAALAVCFWRTGATFVNHGPRRRMPILVSFLLIGLFIWLAENLATFLGAWRYPHQHHGWQPVYLQKLTSWYLLVIVSIVIIAELKRWRGDLVLRPEASA